MSRKLLKKVVHGKSTEVDESMSRKAADMSLVYWMIKNKEGLDRSADDLIGSLDGIIRRLRTVAEFLSGEEAPALDSEKKEELDTKSGLPEMMEMVDASICDLMFAAKTRIDLIRDMVEVIQDSVGIESVKEE